MNQRIVYTKSGMTFSFVVCSSCAKRGTQAVKLVNGEDVKLIDCMGKCEAKYISCKEKV